VQLVLPSSSPTPDSCYLCCSKSLWRHRDWLRSADLCCSFESNVSCTLPRRCRNNQLPTGISANNSVSANKTPTTFFKIYAQTSGVGGFEVQEGSGRVRHIGGCLAPYPPPPLQRKFWPDFYIVHGPHWAAQGGVQTPAPLPHPRPATPLAQTKRNKNSIINKSSRKATREAASVASEILLHFRQRVTVISIFNF